MRIGGEAIVNFRCNDPLRESLSRSDLIRSVTTG